MNDITIVPQRHPQPAVSEQCEHRKIAREHVSLKALQLVLPGNLDDVPHQKTSDPTPLVIILHCESQLGTVGL